MDSHFIYGFWIRYLYRYSPYPFKFVKALDLRLIIFINELWYTTLEFVGEPPTNLQDKTWIEMGRNGQFNKVTVTVLAFVILPLLMIACGGANQPVNQPATSTIAPPTSQVTAAPTITTLPTYTPKPSPTRMPTRTPQPTRTSLYQPLPTETEAIIFENCIPSPEVGYNRCTDNTANIQVDVPDYWADVNGGIWSYQGKDIGVAISAAPILDDFRNSLEAEGVFFGASPTYAQYVGSTELLDIYTIPYRESCDLVGRYNYDDGVYTGKYDKYINCGGPGGSDAYILAAKDKVDPLSKLILIEMQVLPGDLQTRDKIWDTFFVYF
jgi:hypothetical protein